MSFCMRQWFADLREDRGVRELEEKKASHKGKKPNVFEKSPTANPVRLGVVTIWSATRSAEVDIGAAYAKERPYQWDGQRGSEEKYVARGLQIPNGTHDRSR